MRNKSGQLSLHDRIAMAGGYFTCPKETDLDACQKYVLDKRHSLNPAMHVRGSGTSTCLDPGELSLWEIVIASQIARNLLSSEARIAHSGSRR